MINKEKEEKHCNKGIGRSTIKNNEIKIPDESLNLDESEERPGIGYEIFKISHIDD